MKTKEQYIFTETASGDRTNIMSSFPLWNKEMFLEKVKNQSSKYHGRYRYGKIGGYVSLLKDMYLEEFEKVFSANDFTIEQITEIFRKEISEKYGEHAKKAKIKPLSKKELERGFIYEDFSEGKWLYFGEVEKTSPKTRYQDGGVQIGHGFMSAYYSDKYMENWATYVQVLKSPKKLMRKVEDIKVEMNLEYTTTRKTAFGHNDEISILKLI